jgi:DNA/RNA-binding domain of Phe-tRNA-synthetase-like protein
VSGADPALEEGWVGRELALEFPALRLVSVVTPAPGRRTPSVLRERLALLADRFHGARALTLRREPVPHAYRVFFRHVGLDPDVVRTPVEAIALRRLTEGGLHPRGLVEDALVVACLETGVGVVAFDAAGVSGPLALGESDGRLVIADDDGPLADLFGDAAARVGLSRATRRLALVAVAVPNVPDLVVEEALWIAWEILR